MGLVWNDEHLAVISEYAVRGVSREDWTGFGRDTHECLEALRGVYNRCRLFVFVGSGSKITGGGVLGVELLECKFCPFLAILWSGGR